MVEWKPQLPTLLSAIRRYGLAVLSVTLALGAALLFQRLRIPAVFTPFLFAVAVTAWYGGAGAAVLALLLSCLGFDYFFVHPLHSFYVSGSDLPYLIIFAAFGWLVTWFGTVRRRVERELEKRTVELEAVNKELEAFAYSVSHDLRAPLRHVAGFTELLQKNAASQLNEKSQRYIRMILESANRMGHLIDDLLAFSRIGRAETHKTMVNLDQLVQEALTEVRQETDGRNVVWRVGGLPACYGDRSMLRLALVNLISNAVKFTRTRPQAEIQIGAFDQEQNQVVVFIRDNGVGFDMKYANKLFGVFQRLHAPEAFEGTGIGLATVQRIVHRHGGRVWAEGLVDKGATFYFSLFKSQGV
ncbi:MAG TPA: ATP-binding protein [Candidatus Acidoferrum sp.]|nr:ATP-binding protein [Candidatus Acidoferrum sp.]